MQTEHLKVLDAKEKQKKRTLQEKIEAEKKAREAQIVKNEAKRRADAKAALDGEVALVQRLKDELANEQKVHAEKKRQEKEYFQKMLKENEKNQEIKREKKELERREDVKMQEAYARMLDQQEQDRKNERLARERRQ